MKSGGGRNKLQLETLLADSLSHKRFLSGRWSRKYKRRDFKRKKRTLDSEVYEVNTFWNNFSFLWYFSKLICWIFPQNLRLCMLLDYHNNWILVISAMAQYYIKANLLPGKHFGVCYFIDVFVALLRGWKSNRDLFFFFGKYIFCLVTSVKQKKFWVPRRNRTSDLRIPRSDAIPQRPYSKQGLLRSSYMKCVLHNASFVMSLPHHGIFVVQCRASKRGIRRSDVRFLKETQNFSFVPRSWHDEKTFFSISLPSSKLAIFFIQFFSSLF